MRCLSLLLFLSLAACTSAAPRPYAQDYLAALAVTPGSPQDATQAGSRFTALYAQLDAPDLAERVAALYADQLYFNDTLTTLRGRDALVSYLQATAGRAGNMQVTLLGAVADGNDIYLRWHMKFEFKALWRTAHSDTVGMTHLRFDNEGRIVLHQDFWDGAEGIYRHLPAIGAVIGREK